MKFKVLLLIILVLLLSTACTKEWVIISEDEYQAKEIPKDIFETPPKLKVVVDEVEVTAVLGARNWSHFDKKENEMTSFEAETISPWELAEKQKTLWINKNTKVELKFERDPHSYNLYIWDSISQRNGPFSGIVIEESKGKSVYEVVASWEQGTAHYVFSLEVE